MNDPFAVPTLYQKKIKVMFYGEPGSGKTTLALQFPKPALIDMEGSADWYAKRFDYRVLRTKNLNEVENAISFIEQDAGNTYETLVIDPITVLWNIVVEGYSRGAQRIAFNKWGQIKAKMQDIYNRLLNLPIHVVIVARQKDEYSVSESGEPSKVGVKPDAEKGMPFIFDVILRLETQDEKRIAHVEKDRTNTLGTRIDDMSFKPFEAILGLASNGADYHMPSDEDAINEIEQQSVQDVIAANGHSTNGNGTTRPRPIGMAGRKELIAFYEDLYKDRDRDEMKSDMELMVTKENVGKMQDILATRVESVKEYAQKVLDRRIAAETEIPEPYAGGETLAKVMDKAAAKVELQEEILLLHADIVEWLKSTMPGLSEDEYNGNADELMAKWGKAPVSEWATRMTLTSATHKFLKERKASVEESK